MQNNIIELIGVIKKDFMEDIRVIVRETLEDVLSEKLIINVANQDEPKARVEKVTKEVEKAPLNEEVVKEAVKKVAKKAVSQESKKEESEAPSRREELEAMAYNDLKVLVKSLGGKAVGKAEVIIERILELEAQASQEEDEEEYMEVDDSLQDVAEDVQEDVEDEVEEETEDEDDSEDDEDEEYEEDEEDSELEQEFIDFLNQLDDEALLEIGAKVDLGKPQNWDREGFIGLLVANLELLQNALDALGYYDDEDSEDEEIEEEVEDVEEDNELKAQLEALSLEELADLCDEYELSKKGKKQSLIDRLLKAQADGEIEIDLDSILGEDDSEDEDSEDESEEWYTQEELEELDDADLIEIAEVNELEVPYVKKKNKKTLDRATIIEAILSLSDEDEDEEDEEVEEDNSNDSESSESEITISEERYAREEEIEEEIRAKYKAKKLKDSVIKKYLTKYNEGNPTYKAPSASEALEEYIEIKTSMVDDEGETYDLEDCYIRDGKYFCCGRELTDLDKEPYCSVCGTIYEA